LDHSGMNGNDLQRLRIVVRGAVQGVGFRPFIYRLATEMKLSGWVSNSSQGVFIEVEGRVENLWQFLQRIESEKPPRSFIQSMESSYLDAAGYMSFEIHESFGEGEKTAVVLPDIGTCPDCLREIYDPEDRRFRYPFTNCTNCGPRFSIIETLPYDRAGTTMKGFVMCERCLAEYENPLDRRFHAQPNACPECGPHLELWDHQGSIIASQDDALSGACAAIREGKIVAAKGIGGFHLMVDARNEGAVRHLRHLKAREEKPLALMYPSLAMVQRHCDVSALEERLLLSPESPIVLMNHRRSQEVGSNEIAPSVAPGNPCLGIMLPYSPLHHLLLSELGFPVVATSGNRSDEPICTNEREALVRLCGIARFFLVHNRPVARHVDDSIVRVMAGRAIILRRARGYAPLPAHLKMTLPQVLAVGAHLKNTVAIGFDNQVVISQHIGDLETPQAFDAFDRVTKDLSMLYEFEPNLVACDMHPNYISTKFGRQSGLKTISVQHHYAHILSCMAENEIDGPVLGISWDGTGYGLDGTIWGGEFLLVDGISFNRAGHLRTFRLPGGEKAITEPRRSALGLLHEIYGDGLFAMQKLPPVRSFTAEELQVVRKMLENKINSPVTSSMGRLFDVVGAILDLLQITRYEGQAAMMLEFALHGVDTDVAYPVLIEKGPQARIVNWEPMIRQIIGDIESDVPAGLISARFHNTLAEIIVSMAKNLRQKRVVLSGGCFQNKYLTERAIVRLSAEGFRPYWHQRIPPNDGGIALGQAVAAARFRAKE
jgi:hydrogenase maturation protein HypF